MIIAERVGSFAFGCLLLSKLLYHSEASPFPRPLMLKNKPPWAFNAMSKVIIRKPSNGFATRPAKVMRMGNRA